MSKSEQTGGGGGTDPKPARKRPWRKPRLLLVEFAATKGAGVTRGNHYYLEGSNPLSRAYDPNLS